MRAGSTVDLLDPLYESALRPEALETFLRLLSAEIRADAAVLVCHGPDVPALTITSSSAAGRARTGGPEWRRVPDLPHHLGPLFAGSASEGASLSAFRKARSGAFGARELALARSLVPHLHRVLRLRGRAHALDARLNPLAAAMDAVPTGTLVIEGDGTIVFANRQARCLLGRRDGLEPGPGGLRASKPAEHRLLRRLIAEAAHGARVGTGACLAVSRPSMRAPYLVRVAPPRGAGTLPGAGPGRAVVFLVDPEARRAPRHDELVDAFHLTPSQARLAARLCLGGRLADAAAAERTSVETARVHLKAAFRKTGTHRQAGLVGLLLRTCISTAASASDGGPRAR